MKINSGKRGFLRERFEKGFGKNRSQSPYQIPEGMTGIECVSAFLEGACVSFGLGYVFYHSLLPGAAALPLSELLVFRRKRKLIYEKRINCLKRDFRDMADMLSAYLLAGYSVENAMEKTRQQMADSGRVHTDLYLMLTRMQRSLLMGMTAEEVWLEFSEHVPVEEIALFGQIFGLAKRSGASLPDVLKKLAEQLSLKFQTELQIATLVAGKKTEQNVMNFMPAGILVYVSSTSAEMMQVMYTTLAGRLIMTLCLGVYIAAFFLSEKLMSELDGH